MGARLPGCLPKGKKYPWGDREPHRKDAHIRRQNPAAVCGERNRNYFGLCDMIGNVWEWSSDWYARNTMRSLRIAIREASEGMYRVLRGGSWFDQAGSLCS